MINREQIRISSSATLLETLKQMDCARSKLLIITKDDLFVNLITIGDIQRAIIQNKPLVTRISDIDIDNKIVGHVGDNITNIVNIMKEIRADFMPIIDSDSRILDILFREDFSDNIDNFISSPKVLNIPVVIMAGGKGSRLKPISNILPKPLIPIGEKTIIENIMDKFISFGCDRFYLSVNYKKEMIQHYFRTLSDSQYRIEYFIEEKPLGTAGSLHLLKNKISQTFFVSNCDIIIDQDYYELYKYHKENENEITLVAALKHYKIPYGTVESGFGGTLEAMSEKPELTFKINTGFYILQPHLLNEIPENRFFHITELIEQVKNRGGRVGVFPVSEGSWIDIGEWPEYFKAVRSYANSNDHFSGLL